MASTVIRELLVKLGVDSDDATTGLDDLEKALGGVIDVMVVAATAAAALAAALGGMALSAAAAGDAIDKGSQGAAISTDAYQRLAFAASQAGTDIEVVTKALGRQAVALGELEDETGLAGEALADLGFKHADFADLDNEQQFLLTADALSKVTNEQTRLALAVDIFGARMAQDLIPLLALGADSIQAMGDQAEALGFIMSEEDVQAAVDLTDSLDALWTILVGLKNTIGLALIPLILDLADRMQAWFDANAELIGQELEVWLDVLVDGLMAVARVWTLVDDVVQRVFGGWQPILIAIAGLIASILSPVLALIAPFVALFLILDDLIVFFEGGESALGSFLDKFREAEGFMGAVARGIETLIELGSQIDFTIAIENTIRVFEAFGAVLDFIREKIDFTIAIENTMRVFEAFGELLDFIRSKLNFDTAIENTMRVFDAFSGALSAVGGVLGVELGGGAEGGGGEAGGTTTDGGGLFGGELFAPSAAEAGGATTSTATSSSTSVQVAGSTNTVTGVGISADDAILIFEQLAEQQDRSVSAALEGAEV